MNFSPVFAILEKRELSYFPGKKKTDGMTYRVYKVIQLCSVAGICFQEGGEFLGGIKSTRFQGMFIEKTRIRSEFFPLKSKFIGFVINFVAED